jgi:hypothetical protein
MLHGRTSALFVLLVAVWSVCAAACEAEKKAPTLMERINSPDPDTYLAARIEINMLGVAACPLLYSCMQMPDGESHPLRCLRPLMMVCPSSEAGPVVLERLKRNLSTPPGVIWNRDKYYIGALGRLKYQEAVPLLESLLNEDRWEYNFMGPKHLNWALHQITGVPRGPESDPYRMGAKK